MERFFFCFYVLRLKWSTDIECAIRTCQWNGNRFSLLIELDGRKCCCCRDICNANRIAMKQFNFIFVLTNIKHVCPTWCACFSQFHSVLRLYIYDVYKYIHNIPNNVGNGWIIIMVYYIEFKRRKWNWFMYDGIAYIKWWIYACRRKTQPTDRQRQAICNFVLLLLAVQHNWQTFSFDHHRYIVWTRQPHENDKINGILRTRYCIHVWIWPS